MAENAIRKKIEALNKSERSISKVKEEAKSQCTHTLHGDPALVPSNEPRSEGQLKYTCKLCQKPLTISSISDEELQNACNIIDRAIDIIKISAASINNEEESDLIKKLAKTQYRVRNDLVPTYKAAIKKNGRHSKRNNNNHNNNYEAGWARPQVAGR